VTDKPTLNLNVKKEYLKGVKKIAVMSGKGGVGKSTIAANLAIWLAEVKHEKVGLMDIDITGPNIPKLLGIEDEKLMVEDKKIVPFPATENLLVTSMAFLLPTKDSPVIWRGPLKIKAVQQFIQDVNWEGIKYLIIDLPPGTGDEALSIAQELKPLDGSVIVSTPQEVAVLDVRKNISFAKQLEVPVAGIVENMSYLKCPHCGEKIEIFKRGAVKKASEELDVPLLGELPLDPEVTAASDVGKFYIIENKETEFSKAFNGIASKIKDFVDK